VMILNGEYLLHYEARSQLLMHRLNSATAAGMCKICVSASLRWNIILHKVPNTCR